MRRKAEITNPVFTDAAIPSDNIFVVISFTVRDFLDWWFVQMPVVYIGFLRRLSSVINDQLSITLLLKTFFTPWHRDKSFVGYFIGIAVRLIYLPIALLIYFSVIILSTLGVFLWIAMPMIAIILIVLTPLIR
ncbi:MAG: hypothetical protein QY318_00705 [Candidatus Dojkabacteria bacterium]|nr:MAG: hypothetical protein QY318_00705 [Candidatus Dojkabacteria bacterium]